MFTTSILVNYTPEHRESSFALSSLAMFNRNSLSLDGIGGFLLSFRIFGDLVDDFDCLSFLILSLKSSFSVKTFFRAVTVLLDRFFTFLFFFFL